MKKSLLVVLILISLVIAVLHTEVTAAEAVLEPLPVDLKLAAEGTQYQDEAFFGEADKVIASLSNRTIPTGSQRMKVYSAYIRLRDMNVSPENFDTARIALAYLYYTAKAGEAYENYFEQKKSVASLTDGSEFYDLAEIYYKTASNWWDLIADRYPKVTLYTLPGRDDPFPEDDSRIGTVLEGLKLPLIMTHIAPDTNKSFLDEDVRITIQRWIEDNVDAIPNLTGTQQSPGNYFLTSDGPKNAKSTFIDLSTKNVNPDFYDTANYIDAFFYFMSQAYEYYEQYQAERTSILQISDGEKPYNLANSYYEQAEVALSLFKDDVPEMNKSTTLPSFPEFDEVEKGRKTMQELENQWSGTDWSHGASFN